jgi:N-acetylmuramoyl-L-alanine amidase
MGRRALALILVLLALAPVAGMAEPRHVPVGDRKSAAAASRRARAPERKERKAGTAAPARDRAPDRKATTAARKSTRTAPKETRAASKDSRTTVRKSTRPSPEKARAAARPTLDEAKAALTALARDRTRRRFRHNWERAIDNVLRAARGPDAGPALLEAARARYALYRWSAVEDDRDEALELATRASRRGAKDGAVLAAAIRREAGDDRPASRAGSKRPQRIASAPARPQSPAAKPTPTAGADAPDAAESGAGREDDPPDPALEAAVRDLAAPAEPRPLGDSGGAGAATVDEVRAWSSGDYTRVAIYLSHWVGWKKHELAAEGDRPRRLAIDLRPATLPGKAVARPVAGDQVDRVRTAQNDAETVRVVLDLAGDDAAQVFALEDPPRLIVDVGAHPRRAPAVAETTPEHASGEARSQGPAEPPPAGQPGAAAAEEATPGAIRRVVVDAGHGGHDPGAIGPTHVEEKDVTLAIARRLARKLRAGGFQVILTRDRDRYLALEERTAIANTARGDLFVSIHANAHPRRSFTGVETYFLNVTDDRYAARLAARENGLGADGQGEVGRILTDLDAKSSAGVSHRLAQLVQREVCSGVRAHVGGVQDLGVKSALFYVLLGARMPAVLVETAFISNREEERRLASARYQEEVADGVARAISAFARSGMRVASVR